MGSRLRWTHESMVCVLPGALRRLAVLILGRLQRPSNRLSWSVWRLTQPLKAQRGSQRQRLKGWRKPSTAGQQLTRQPGLRPGGCGPHHRPLHRLRLPFQTQEPAGGDERGS